VIPREEVFVTKQTCSIHPAPEGNYRKEGAFLINKTNQDAAHLLFSNLSVMDTFIFHQGTYVPSMTYLLPLTIFDPGELNKIQ
jgi:hypothetical protein